MDLIFLVSGVGTWFALNSRKSHFLSDRIKRLIIPFIFGVIIIVPPQKFYETISFHGFHENFMEFLKAYPSYLFSQDFGTSILLWFGHLGSHIYYLPYLFVMTIIVVPIYFLLEKAHFRFKKLQKIFLTPWGIFLLLIPMLLIRVGLKPLFPVYTDWADFFSYLCMFLYGFIFIKNPDFVEILKGRTWLFLNIGIISSALLMHFISLGDSNLQTYTNPHFGLSHLYLSILAVLISFSWVMFFIGLAAKHLNFNHKFLQRANSGILPIYILHQTLIIVFGFYIIQLNTSVFFKYLLIVGTAIPSSVLLYLALKRVSLLRVLFGLKGEAKKNVTTLPDLEKQTPVYCGIINGLKLKTIKRFFLFVAFVLAITPTYSQNKHTYTKLNILGAGYGVDYFINPKISFYNELGLSYWGKINDKIRGEKNNPDLSALNPYLRSSVRFFFVPMHPAKKENISIGWCISTTYTGEFALYKDFKSSGVNSHQFGVFAGTTIHFSGITYFEFELGPGCDFGNMNDYKFNLLGNMGFGFIF